MSPSCSLLCNSCLFPIMTCIPILRIFSCVFLTRVLFHFLYSSQLHFMNPSGFQTTVTVTVATPPPNTNTDTHTLEVNKNNHFTTKFPSLRTHCLRLFLYLFLIRKWNFLKLCYLMQGDCKYSITNISPDSIDFDIPTYSLLTRERTKQWGMCVCVSVCDTSVIFTFVC